jgi:hypothetical protein
MNKWLVRALKAALIGLSLPLLFLCFYGLPFVVIDTFRQHHEMGEIIYPVVFLLYILSVPYFYVLILGFKLLINFNQGKIFSQNSHEIMKKINFSLIIVSSALIIIQPFLYVMAQREDAPGILLLGLIFTFGAVVLTLFSFLFKFIIASGLNEA